MRSLNPALLVLLCTVAPAFADDLAPITLFGQRYNVQRFDYSQVEWNDPLNAGSMLQLIQVEGAHSLGSDRLLLSTDSLDKFLSYKNWIIEVRIVRDGGKAIGLEYVRTAVINDPVDMKYGGFDLSPCGITVNSGATGLAANGNLLLGDSEANRVVGYSIASGSQLGDFSGGSENESFDDVMYSPTNDLVYTINEDGETLVSYTTSGSFVAATFTPGLTALNSGAVPGSPKGMTFLPDAATVPATIRRAGGTILVTLDDDNPGLQAYDLAGAVVGTEPLTDDAINGGASLLDQGSGCGNQLQFEACAFDAATGTIFLVNEGDFTDCSGFYILTPDLCPVDFDGDGFVTGIDFDLYVAAFEGGDMSADFDHDGFITGIDFDLYVGAFEAGC